MLSATGTVIYETICLQSDRGLSMFNWNKLAKSINQFRGRRRMNQWKPKHIADRNIELLMFAPLFSDISMLFHATLKIN